MNSNAAIAMQIMQLLLGGYNAWNGYRSRQAMKARRPPQAMAQQPRQGSLHVNFASPNAYGVMPGQGGGNMGQGAAPGHPSDDPDYNAFMGYYNQPQSQWQQQQGVTTIQR